MKIDGKKIAEKILDKLNKPVNKKLVAILVRGGEGDEASMSFIRQKKRVAERLGIDFEVKEFEGLSTNDLRREVERIGRQSSVGGVIVQLPLPERYNKNRIIKVIPREKDVDALGRESMVKSPAIKVVEYVLEEVGFKLEGKKVAVVGAGKLVGRPIINYLTGRVASLGVYDKGSDLNELLSYDLVISGVGRAGLIKSDYLKAGAGVIDFGYEGGKGDLEGRETGKLGFYTPTPGGTGPILVAALMENFFVLQKSFGSDSLQRKT